MKSLNVSKVSLMFLGLVSLCLNVVQAVQRPIFYNHPSVWDYEHTFIIRPGSIDKLNSDGTRSTVVSGLDRPSGIALDAAGNLYYGNVTSGSTIISLFKRTRDGTVMNLGEVVNTSGGSVSVSGWGFDVVVSPSGDIFYNHPRVFVPGQGTIRAGSIDKLSPEGTRSTVVSDLDKPSGIAFDAAGNLYYGNVTSGSIRISLFKRTPDGAVTNLGEVVNTSGGSVSIVGWGFDVAIGPAIICVDVDAPGNNDGSSWTDAYNDLQDALATAQYGDEIWVAQGIYKPDQGGWNTPGDREATFQLISGVTIKGGYAGFGETDPDSRDIDAYETILSGDLNGNDIDINDLSNLWDEPSRAENSLHVVTGSGTDSNAIFDGFTITAGNANGPIPDRRGGGMYNTSGSPKLNNCIFSENSARSSGGGMYNRYSSSPIVANCTFSGNSAEYGGGMDNYYSDPNVTNCTFIGNSAEVFGGGMCNSESNPILTNCIFSGNVSYKWGGAIYNVYSGMFVSNCTFTGNWAVEAGGGIYITPPPPSAGASTVASYYVTGTITNCIFWDNLPEQIVNWNSPLPWVTYCDVQGGRSGVFEPRGAPSCWREGNIDADPCFVQPGYWDANGVWVEGDYHLLEDSICINTGDPNFVPEPNEADLDGKPRVIGGRIDMGAYEYANTAPVACIVDGNQVVEAEAPWGARVTLDGSCSSDADSAPGTNDDIAQFDWYKVDACDPNFEDFLASGEIIDCNLPLGEHIIVLEVIDKAGAFDTNEVTIIVQDTTPPDFTLSVTPTTLWPANHKMVLIRPSWTASDICDASPEVSLVSITMNEGDEAKGDGHTAGDIQTGDDGSIRLRAERSGSGSGRIYTITYQAVDDSGNAAVASATVTVPHDQR